MKKTTKSKKDSIPSIISDDLKIVGNLISEGTIEIEGEIEGNIKCDNATVRRTGMINGDLIAESISIEGEVNGLVKARNVNVSENGIIKGVIMYEALSVKDGAFIDGQCKSIENIHNSDVEKISSFTDENLNETNFVENEAVNS